jgi:hypothetical protein
VGLFHDTLGGLDDHPDLNVPEGFGQAISGAYDADLAESSSSAEAKIADLMRQLDEANEAVTKLKVTNYDLLMETAATAVDADDVEADENRDGPAASDAELPDTIDGLFEPADPDNDLEV